MVASPNASNDESKLQTRESNSILNHYSNGHDTEASAPTSAVNPNEPCATPPRDTHDKMRRIGSLLPFSIADHHHHHPPTAGTSKKPSSYIPSSLSSLIASWSNTPLGKHISFLLPPDLLFSALVVICTLVIYGFLQESVMTRKYISRSSKVELSPSFDADVKSVRENLVEDRQTLSGFMNSSVFLVFQNRLYAMFISLAIIIYNQQYQELANIVPWYKYGLVSLCNVVATSCQYEALKWVNFPTQSLFKCFKMVPVMVIGTLILSKKSYRWTDYAAALVVALGCFVFVTSGNVVASRAAKLDTDTNSTVMYGILLMSIYLICDSFTSTLQEYLFRVYDLSVVNQMLHVNITSSIVSLIIMAMLGQLESAFSFAWNSPQVLIDTSLLSISAVCAQYAITHTVRKFGALTYVTIMTVRQIISVVLSNVVFGHHLTALQWACSMMVFVALVFQRAYSQRNGTGT